MKGKILFKEEQSFVGTWTWYLLIFVSLIATIPMLLVISNGEKSNEALVGLIITLFVLGSILTLMTFCRLYLTIDTKAIYYRYPPFVNKEKRLSKEDIVDMEVRKYRPIWEYGGYGYRYSMKSGRALNVSGKVGLQLILSDKKKLLIGTAKPEALKRAIVQLQSNWNNPDQHA